MRTFEVSSIINDPKPELTTKWRFNPSAPRPLSSGKNPLSAGARMREVRQGSESTGRSYLLY